MSTLYINYCGVITHNNVNQLRAIICNAMNPQPHQPNIPMQKIDSFYFTFSSPGGETGAGIELYNFLRSLSTTFTITMHNVGQIASIANVIFLAADHRYASNHSSFLLHGVTTTLPAGNYTLSSLKERCSHIEKEQDKISSIITARTKIQKKSMDKLYLEGEAKNLKFAIDNNIITETAREFILPANALFINFNINHAN